MRALVWTNPKEFQLQSVSQPEPARGEVVVRVHYAGICGSDLSGYLGENSLRKPPLIMGHEFTGTIVATGKDVSVRQTGELVTVNPLISCGRCRQCERGLPQHCTSREILGIHRPGAFAEFVSVPESSCLTVQNDRIGALTEPLACSIRAVRQARVQWGQQVVVMGAGIIGLFSAWAARQAGAEQVVVADTNDSRLELAYHFGATSTANVRHSSIVKEVVERFDGGADSVIDAVGLSVTRSQSIDAAAPGGRVAWIGLHEEESAIPANAVVRKEVETVGSFCYVADDFRTAHQMLEQGRLKVSPSWLSIRPADEIKKSFDEQVFGPAHYPKILLSFLGDDN